MSRIDVGRGEHDRRGLAGHAGDAENRRSQDARQRVGQHVRADRLPLGRAERERAFAEALRHGLQRLLARGDDHRQHHEREREPAGEQRNVPAEENDEHAEAEQAEHDRRHAGEIEDREAHEANEATVAAYSLDKSRC